MTNAEYVNKYTSAATEKRKVIEQLKATPKTNEEKIAQHKLLNDLQGKETQATGILTSNDVATKQLIINSYEKVAKDFEAEADKVKVLNNDQLRAYYYEDYTNSQIRKLADPYAASKSRDKVSIQREMKQDPYLELEMYRRKKQIDKEWDAVEPLVTTSPGVTLNNADQVKSMTKILTDLNKNRKDIEDKLNELNRDYNKTKNPVLMNEIVTLKAQLNKTVARINTVSQAQFKIDKQMEEQGMNTNSSLVTKHIGNFINILNKPGYTGVTTFNSNHYALIAPMNSEERKKLFGTDDIEKIKKQNITDINKKLHQTYNYNFADPASYAKISERIQKAVDWTSDNLYDESYDIPYTYELNTFLSPEWGGGTTQSVNPFEQLRNQIQQNSDEYVRKSNQAIFITPQAEFLHTDPEKGNAAMVTFIKSLAPAFTQNPHSFKNSLGNQITLELDKKVFYKGDGKTVGKADLRAVKPGDISIPKEPLNGSMYGQVPLRDSEGNLLFEKNTKGVLVPATTWFVPDNEANWNSALLTMGLENMNATITRVSRNAANYGKDNLINLNNNERMQYFETDNNAYINHLSQVAAVNYVTTWQQAAKGNSIAKGKVVFLPDSKGGYYAIARGFYDNGVWKESEQYGLYGARENEKGELEIDKKPTELYQPHLGVRIGVMKPETKLLFNSLNELGQAVQFFNSFEINK
jgi:hypothetical protein